MERLQQSTAARAGHGGSGGKRRRDENGGEGGQGGEERAEWTGAVFTSGARLPSSGRDYKACSHSRCSSQDSTTYREGGDSGDKNGGARGKKQGLYVDISVRKEQAPGTRQRSSIRASWTAVRVCSAVVTFTHEFFSVSEKRMCTARLRIKQNLVNEYDASGYTHAALFPSYGEPRKSYVLDATEEQPGCVVGEDYSGNSCICGTLFGTQYELRVVSCDNDNDSENTVPDDELFKIVSTFGLATDSTTSTLFLQQFRYATATYWRRFPKAKHAYRGPTSLFGRILWNYGLAGVSTVWRTAEEDKLPGENIMQKELPLSFDIGRGSSKVTYGLDSIGVCTHDKKRKDSQGISVKEILAFYHSKCKHCHVWIRMIKSRSSFPGGRLPLHPSYPRQVSEKIDNAEDGSSRNIDIHLACITEKWGSWEAGWCAQRKEFIVLVQASPNGGSTKAAFESFARSIARSQYL